MIAAVAVAIVTMNATTLGDATFAGPVSVRCRPDGQYLVVDDLDHRIIVFDRSGERVRVLGRYGAGPGQLMWPDAVHWDDQGLLYIADTGAQRVQVWRETGEYVRQIGRTPASGRLLLAAILTASLASLFGASLPTFSRGARARIGGQLARRMFMLGAGLGCLAWVLMPATFFGIRGMFGSRMTGSCS
jgi:hypothetical protein